MARHDVFAHAGGPGFTLYVEADLLDVPFPEF